MKWVAALWEFASDKCSHLHGFESQLVCSNRGVCLGERWFMCPFFLVLTKHDYGWPNPSLCAFARPQSFVAVVRPRPSHQNINYCLCWYCHSVPPYNGHRTARMPTKGWPIAFCKGKWTNDQLKPKSSHFCLPLILSSLRRKPLRPKLFSLVVYICFLFSEPSF